MNVDYDLLNLKHLLPIAFFSGSPTSRHIWHRVKEQLEQVAKSHSEDDLVDIVLQCSLNHPLVVKFPINCCHVNKLLSWLIDIWRSNNWQGEETFSTLYLKEQLQSEISYNTYFLGHNMHCPLTLLESNEGIVRGTTGLSSWGAARVLASWCFNNITHIKGNVLELGCGIGFTACSLLSCSETTQNITSYTATDYHPHVLSILYHNLSLLESNQMNHSIESLKSFRDEMNLSLVTDELSPGEFRNWKPEKNFQVANTKTRVVQLDWRHPANLPECDVILAADVVYAVHLFPDLIRVIRLLLLSEGANKSLRSWRSKKNKIPKQRQAFIACTRRSQETLSEFLAQVRQQNLNYEEVYQSTLEREESLFGFDESHLPIKIYKLTVDKCSSSQAV